MRDLRTNDLARIHIYKAHLSLKDDEYRALLHGLTGHDSAKGLDQGQRWKVIKEMGRLAGVKEPVNAPRGGFIGKPARQTAESGKQALLGKIEALLADRKLPWQYAHNLAQHMFKVSCVEWCGPDQLWRIVAALEVHKKRLAKKAPQTIKCPKKK